MATLPALHRDLATSLRSLAKRPLYSALCLGTLALGIGTSVAMYSVVHAVLIRPLPVTNQSRLVLVTQHPRNDRQVLPFSYPDQLAIGRLSGIVESSAGTQYDAPLPLGIRTGGQAFNLNVTSVTGSFFAVLGARAELGRLTTAAQSEPGLIISRRLWQTRFQGDSAAVGRSVWLGDSFAATIIGIAPAGFDFPHGSEAWYVVRPEPGKEADYAWFSGLVRLTPGTSLERLRSAVQAIVSSDTTHGVMVAEVEPFLDAAIGNLRSPVTILAIAAGLVFLVSIANAASLLLVQGSARARELAIRSALGASGAHVVRLLTVEASLLAAGAAGLGTVLSLVVLRALALIAPADVPRVGDVEAGPALIAAVVTAATVAILLAGAIPALWLSRRSPFAALRSAQPGLEALGGSGRLRERLVAMQIALAVVVVIGAGLLIRTLDNLNRIDLGVDRAEVTVVRVTPSGSATAVPVVQRFYDQLTERVAAIPGVQGVSPVTSRPFVGWRGWTTTFAFPDQDATQAARNPWAAFEVVGPEFFRTMGIRILAGRAFDRNDRVGQPRRVVVNEMLAHLAWPGQTAIGRQLTVGNHPAEIVGLARDTRFRDLLAATPTIYLALAQADSSNPVLPQYLAVKSGLAPERVASLVQEAAREVDGGATVYETSSMGQAMRAQLARPRLSASLLIGFAGVTLLLVGAGLFATLSALVQQRTREIGVRIALGARPAQLSRYVIQLGLRIAGVGLAVGLVVSLVATTLIRKLLYGVEPADPFVLLLTAAIIVTIVAAASLAPMLRALRVDPMQSLRDQ